MWRVRNESTGKEVLYYEAELIEKIRKECQKWNYATIFSVDYGKYLLAQEILDLIEQYEKEGE